MSFGDNVVGGLGANDNRAMSFGDKMGLKGVRGSQEQSSVANSYRNVQSVSDSQEFAK